MFAKPGTPYYPTPRQHDEGGRRPRARGCRGKNLVNLVVGSVSFSNLWEFQIFSDQKEIDVFSFKLGKVCLFSLWPQLTGANIFKKSRLPNKNGLFFLHSCQLVSVFFLRGEFFASIIPMNPITNTPSLLQQRCWLFTSMISNCVGRRHTKSARKP